jgi:hypothetical protein
MLKKLRNYWNKLTLPIDEGQEAPVLPLKAVNEPTLPTEKAVAPRVPVDKESLQKLKTMIDSGDEVNISLAFQLIKGLQLTSLELSFLIRDRDKREFVCFRNGYLEPFVDLNVLDFGRWKQKVKEIPAEIGELISLKRIILPGHHLNTLPPEIQSLTKLEWLNLYDNQINCLPEEIGGLKGLRWLFLRDNYLETLPESVGNLKNLIRLNLSNNHLTSLPDEVGNLPLLDELNLNNNRLTELPESIKNLKKLTRLYVKDNPISFQQRGELRFLLPNTKIFF